MQPGATALVRRSCCLICVPTLLSSIGVGRCGVHALLVWDTHSTQMHTQTRAASPMCHLLGVASPFAVANHDLEGQASKYCVQSCFEVQLMAGCLTMRVVF